MVFCSNISVSFDFFVLPVPAYIQRNTPNKIFIINNRFHDVKFMITAAYKMFKISCVYANHTIN
ncbi:hypothetical protein BpHYR1_004528 [Brachionus plicatilis]|uniref:Uncharacterized protein n=1 Tax=Brachionus plicatilis TaxID=10195 RepID=A0A3M7PID9_BRAPC|nr:hypothetical protein BpHYR1_004528 [Brachionus plicatilis]